MLSSFRGVAPTGVRATCVRSLFAQASAMPQVGVDEEFPHVPATSSSSRPAAVTTASTTASGLKIASSTDSAYVATLGVQVAAGSRFESEQTAGLAQLFGRMAFRATTSRSDLRLFRDIEAFGGVVNASAGRDFVRYNISVLPDHVDAAAEVLAETTLAPRFGQWDIEQQKQVLQVELAQLRGCSERTVVEELHAAAFYDDATLGRPVITADNLSKFSADDLWAFYEQYVNTASLVVVGSGVAHSTLTDVANSLFSQVPAASNVVKPKQAVYVGGESRVKKPTAKQTYVALAFPTAGRGSADEGASQVLQAVLASRLDAKKAQAYAANYAGAGLVGFVGHALPADVSALVDSFIAEIKKVAATAPTVAELAAAKKVAGLNATAAAATRLGQMERLAALAFSQTAAASPASVVEGVSAKAVQELAQKALTVRPSLASVGKASAVPRLDAVISKLK